ncbi:MAG: 5'-nucleotidase C-terminal domain-containing protein [Herpetosiphonaceae bacterium]|nr:5'-nucleotidase C-terminal domain-containing protein [Herpetosiphonaceae bacterium]
MDARNTVGLQRKVMVRTTALFLLTALLMTMVGRVQPAQAAEELCFNQPGVFDCVAPEFREFWQSNGGLPVFGYPQTPARQEQTPEGSFLVQYFERQRLEYHPEKAAPFMILLGRINDEVLGREGRNWRAFPLATPAGDCVRFDETGQSACGEFLRYWRSQGLDMGDGGVSFRESLALWGLPLSAPMTEINVDGDEVLTQHFERARIELHASGKGGGEILLTRLGVMLVPLDMKLLTVNDFHGQISTGRKVSNKDVGGAAILAAYFKQERAKTRYSLTVHAGDAIGASGPSSALLQDQPTLDFMNRIGFDVGTIGNHEFDDGFEELMRVLNGGCHPVAGCWDGVDFPMLAANVIDKRTNKTILPAYTIINVAGARIGFIGVVLKGTAEIVIPSAVTNLEFRDEAASINAAVAELNKQGVHAIVALVHEGGTQNTQTGVVTGPIVGITEAMDDDVDVVVSGHTHTSINAMIDGKLVTQALSYSTAFGNIDLTIDRAKRDIVSKKATIVTTFHEGMTPDPEIAAMVKAYEDQVAPKVNRKVGVAATTITAEQNAAGESALGNLIADAQRAQMGSQFAFMNPGGIRAPIDAGDVTWGELYSVQPFSNDVVKLSLSGEQVYTLLNQQWQPQSDGSVRTRFLQISGLAYTWSDANPVGQKVVEVRGADGQPISRAATYTVTVNSFLAAGGDAFTILIQGTDRVVGPTDLDALINYVEKLPQPFSASIENRIVKQ